MNIPIMCQELLNWILSDALDKNSIVYFNNILIYLKIEIKYIKYVQHMFTKIKNTWLENQIKELFLAQKQNKNFKILNWNTQNHYKIKQN